ncbi:MAG: sialate O-acetylesterase [Proteobacteria bacterium]|nr:sialate O-acetylesterase [Pseudomonadota bacterium]MBU1713880.1 sialate O-acetylesterase [Pseudomonadota bacterium]
MLKTSALSRISAVVFIMMLFFGISIICARDSEGQEVHLFILSGQSNMAGLDTKVSFEPAVRKAFSGDEVIVVKYALGGRPIHRWYKKWSPGQGEKPKATGDIYDRLMAKIKTAIAGKNPDTVTFVWMQGERDAREQYGEFYAARLKGLIEQLREDLGREDVNFVIGRLSDHAINNKRYLFWMLVRSAQVEIAESDPHGTWIDTDDLNGSDDELHYTKDGYAELGKRFAEKTIELIRKSDKSKTLQNYAELSNAK